MDDAVRDILEIGRLLYDKGYIVATDGNLSVLLEDERILITPSGKRKEKLNEDDLVIIDKNGTVLSGKHKPSSEIYMHLWIYEQRPDVKAIIHAHPPHATAYSFVMPREYTPQLAETRDLVGKINFVPYREPGSKELAAEVKEKIKDSLALVLHKHGVIVGGASLWDAFSRLERLEFEMKIRMMRRAFQ